MPLSPNTVPTWRPDLEEYSANVNLELFRAQLIGGIVLPEYDTDKATGQFFQVNRDQARRKHIVKHTSGAGFTRIVQSLAQGTYDTEDYGVEVPCDMKRRDHYGAPIDWEKEDSMLIDFTMMVAHEARVAETVLDTDVFTANPVTTKWETVATADPQADIDTRYNAMRKKTAIKKDQLTLVVSYNVYQYLLKNAKVLAGTKYTTSVMTLGTEAEKRKAVSLYLGIKDILVGQSSFISSPDGADTTTITDVWSDDYALLAHIAPSKNAPRTYPCLGRTIRWEKNMPSFVTMETYGEPKVDVDVTRGRQFTDEYLVAAEDEYATLLHVSEEA